MKPFAIIADNACALQKPLRERFGMDAVVLGSVTYPDGHSELSDIDYERTTPEEYFGSMTKKAIYKTACANLDQIKDVMYPFVKEGKDIVFLCLSSALSGTYNFVLKAAEEAMQEYPQVHIYVIDSLRYSSALGLLVQEACALRDQGLSAKETAEWIEENKHCFHQAGIMDDLYFLARTGRIAKAKAFFGTKPKAPAVASMPSSLICKTASWNPKSISSSFATRFAKKKPNTFAKKSKKSLSQRKSSARLSISRVARTWALALPFASSMANPSARTSKKKRPR